MNLETYTRVAQDALWRYGLSGAQLRIVKSSNNAVFRVTTGNEHFALRVHRPGYRKLAWIEAELEWLSAILTDTDLGVPRPAAPIFHGRVGEEPVYCTLLTWLDGAHVAPAETTEQQAYQMGRFAGRLHEHSARIDSVLQGELPTLDLEERLADRSGFGFIKDSQLLSQVDALLDALVFKLRIVIQKQKISTTAQIRIHSDLIWKNFLFHNTNIHTIDFDDSARGFPLYDLAPLLLGLLDEANYPRLKQAIWAGYTSVRPHPDSAQDSLNTLIAARFALSIQWIAANRSNPSISNRAEQIIAERIQRLRLYLDTGELKRGEIIF